MDTRDLSIRRYHIMNINMIIMFPFSIILLVILGFSGPQKRKKIICTLSLRVRTQSLSSLLNTIDCPSRCPMTCLILTSRLSGLKSTHYWVRDDGYLGLKKKIPPAAGTLIGNLLKRRAGLRRPTASGLNCDRRSPP